MSRKTKKSARRKAAQGGRGGEDAVEPEAEGASFARRVWDQVGPIGIAVLVALAIRAMIIESYYVPSGSMLPTMFIGDHVFVSKFSYGSHVPFTDWTLPALRDPERGEIVVFALGRGRGNRICPLDECPDFAEEGFVKRIVAIPGDTVEYRDGNLVLNGRPAELTDLDSEFVDERGVRHRVLEEDFDGCRHRVLDVPGHPGLTQTPYTIPEDRYFVMGDNRDNSNDSRGWGTVHRDHLKGPVLINYWAWNNRGSWLSMLNPLTWLDLLWNEMYWDRIGMDYDCRE